MSYKYRFIVVVLIFLFKHGDSRVICKYPCPIPMDVDVKCGSNGIDYQNLQELLCAKSHCDPCESEFALFSNCLLHKSLISDMYLAHDGPCGMDNKANLPSEKNLLIENESQPSQLDWSNRIPEKGRLFSASTQSLLSSNNPLQDTKESILSQCLDSCVCGFVLVPVCASNGITYGDLINS